MNIVKAISSSSNIFILVSSHKISFAGDHPPTPGRCIESQSVRLKRLISFFFFFCALYRNECVNVANRHAVRHSYFVCYHIFWAMLCINTFTTLKGYFSRVLFSVWSSRLLVHPLLIVAMVTIKVKQPLMFAPAHATAWKWTQRLNDCMCLSKTQQCFHLNLYTKQSKLLLLFFILSSVDVI